MVQFLAMMTGGGGGIGRANKACQVAVVLFLGCIALAWTLSMLWSEPLVGTTQLRQKGRKGGSGSGYPAAAERGRVVTNTNQAFLDESLRQEALDFVLSRQKAYNDSGIGVNWKLRGNGYLYTHKKLVLAAQVPPGGKSVHIYDVLSALNGTSAARTPRDDCEKLTMWVRVYGPEIYAGSAEAVPATETSDCFWKYDFEAVPGVYAVDAKVLLWNAKDRDYEAEQACKTQSKRGELPRDFLDKLYPTHSGFKGFKLYYPTESCCEICNRLSPHCKLWTSPPAKMQGANYFSNGCELYFDASYPESEIPKSWILGDVVFNGSKHAGPARRLSPDDVFGAPVTGLEPQQFLGCGWSYWYTLDFPCLSGAKDDRVFMLNDTFEVTGPPPPFAASLPLPLCESSVELVNATNGRWVQEPKDSCPVPFEDDPKFNEHYPVHKHDGDHPHCWNRDNIAAIGNNCVEMNCQFIDTGRYWNSRARVTDWYGVWREKSCDYLEFTDKQLQQCITSRKIASFEVEGRSIATMLQSLLHQRLSTLTLYPNSTDPNATHVTITTLALLHHTMDSNEMFRNHLQKEPNATANRPYYYMTGYFTSSEREPYTFLERMKTLNHVLDEVLPPKGYVRINAFDPSAAWTYDADGQRDGMHIVGPPMRSVVTKVFHYLCKDVVEGSRQ